MIATGAPEQPDLDPRKETLSLEEAAHLADLTPKTLSRLTISGQLDAIRPMRVRGSWQFDTRSFTRWLERTDLSLLTSEHPKASRE